MSNWVYNYIKVYGKDEELKKFKEDVALNNDIVFSFEKFVARPEDTSSWAASGIPGWYMWGLENWGTKWDCWDSELNEKKDHLEYKFITAWDAPYPIYDTMIEKYKKLNFNIDIWESVNYWTLRSLLVEVSILNIFSKILLLFIGKKIYTLILNIQKMY